MEQKKSPSGRMLESIMLILSPFFRLSVFQFPRHFQISLIKRDIQFHTLGIRQKLFLDWRSHIFHGFRNIRINPRCGCSKNRASQCTSLFRSDHRYRKSEHIGARSCRTEFECSALQFSVIIAASQSILMIRHHSRKDIFFGNLYIPFPESFMYIIC